jgi:hypothetical protein
MKDTCKRGHDLATTAYTSPKGHRQCVECVKIRRAERAAERQEIAMPAREG